MAEFEKTMITAKSGAEDCDIRIWSGDCRQSSYNSDGEKYLCASCEKIPGLDHEVRHEIYPYVSGDTDNLY